MTKKQTQHKRKKVPLFQRELNTPAAAAVVPVAPAAPEPPLTLKVEVPLPPPPGLTLPTSPIVLKDNGRWKKTYLETCWEKMGVKSPSQTKHKRWVVSNQAYDPTDWINLPETVPEYAEDAKARITAGAYIFTHRPLTFDNFVDYQKLSSSGKTHELCVLLVEPRTRCRFSIPKGHLKPGELAHECAMREIYQETGLNLHIKPTTPYVTFTKWENTQIMYLIYVPYQLLPPTLTPIDQHEIRFAFWANCKFIQNNLSFCNYTLAHKCNTTGHYNINPIIRFIMSNIGEDQKNDDDPLNHAWMYYVKIYDNKYYMYELIERFIDAGIISIHTVWNRWEKIKFW